MTIRYGCVAALLTSVCLSHGMALASHRLAECEAAGREVIRVGLEREHSALSDIATREVDSSVDGPDLGACVAIALGSDYQILDWLENGKLDAAVLSPFAAELVRAERQEGREYFSFTSEWPLGDAAFQPQRLQVTVTGSSTSGDPAAAAYDRFILTLGRADREVTASISLSSHLSAALPLLIEYTHDRIEVLAPSSQIDVSVFWGRFVNSLSFAREGPPDTEELDFVLRTRLTRHPCFGDAPEVLVIPACSAAASGVSNVLVFGPKAGRVLYGKRPVAESPPFGRNIVRQWLKGDLDSKTYPDTQHLQAFLEQNHALHEIGFRKRRHFRFTLAELWDEFDSVDPALMDAPFALVLTGGGVKAAYQTRMIDHLYGGGLLSNRTDAGPDRSIDVDYVVGTSGGALLGIFVSAIDTPDDLNLTDELWRNEEKGRYTASYDVFPIIEMPRYLSVLMSVLVFALMLFLARRSDYLRSTTIEVTIPAQYRVVETLDTWFSPRATWAVLIFVTPLVIKRVTGVPGLEHVPAISGIFYSICVFIALYSDNRLIFRRGYTWGDLSLSGRQLFLLFSGSFLALVPLINQEMGVVENRLLPLLGSYIGIGTLVCCIGFVVVFFAVHRIFRANDTVHVKDWLILKAFVTIMLAPIAAYLLLFVTGRPMFELNGEFWTFLLAYSIVASIVLILLARVGRNPAGNPLTVGMDFLAADFPGATYHITLKRYLRVAVFVLMAFFWWNLVVAPGIYGNEKAKEHFVGIYKKPACRAGALDRDACKTLDLDSRLFVPPTVKFVISATSLEEQREWYFLLHPELLTTECRDMATVESGELLNELRGSDPRWQFAGCEFSNEDLVDIAFASGSPFPVFPATKVPLPEDQEDVWLVDGGYAHNVPIEAARAVSAGRVLVLSSSPLHRPDEEEEDAQDEKIENQLFGNLSNNLQRLFPYLFERSQVEDKLSAEGMFVATISPSLQWTDWPALTDFRHEVVEDLVDYAEQDLAHRVGVVESWGPAICRLGRSRFDCDVMESVRAVDTDAARP